VAQSLAGVISQSAVLASFNADYSMLRIKEESRHLKLAARDLIQVRVKIGVTHSAREHWGTGAG
jgi:hypothetical protein